MLTWLYVTSNFRGKPSLIVLNPLGKRLPMPRLSGVSKKKTRMTSHP
jgi:hypothetical protein